MKKVGVAVLLLCAVALAQWGYDASKPPEVFTPLVVFPVPVLRSAGLGLDSALASLIWLNAIQQIGEVYGSYEGLIGDIRTINALDPQFAYPYAFAELVIPSLDPSKLSDAIAIGQRGVEHTADWRIPFYLASTYVVHLDDRENALKYFGIAARTPGIPSRIQATALNYGTQKDKRAQTKAIWESLYESSDDELLREQAYTNLVHIGILEMLEEGIRRYKASKGKNPKEVQDLVRAGLIREVPQDPLGFVYTIADDGTLVPSLPQSHDE
ncbi:hypothetical protein FJY93_03550 [Candidatus Kaiserbacteria bacterium]|nr:hypothetical protein [Candidatus Kaiserbacteria bacterium]